MQGKIEICSRKQIVDKFSKETSIKDPIVDTFLSMEDNMPDLGHYPVLGSRNMNTTYGIDPGHNDWWAVFTTGNFDRGVNPEKYYDGDWKRVEKNGEKHLAKTVKRTVTNPRGRATFTGITPY